MAARDIFGFAELWREIDELGNSIDLETQIGVLLDARRMTERGTVWLLRHRRPPLDVGAAVDEFSAGLTFLGESLEDVVGGRVLDTVGRLRDARVLAGVPVGLAARSARWPWLHTGFDIVEIAHSESCNVADAGNDVLVGVRRLRGGVALGRCRYVASVGPMAAAGAIGAAR